jgi:uncharacterized protein YndB with AHSA1/START domain
MSEHRKHDLTIEIDAPVEEVWKAITEAENIVRWFAPEARVTPGEGGSVFLSWGEGMGDEVKILIWEPNRRLRTGPGGDSPRTVDYILEAKGGATVLRLVHSGFGADASFDDEFESTFGGWSMFLAMLKFGLERHRGAPARNVTFFRMLDMPWAEAWERARGPQFLALEGDPQEGERYTAGPLSGRVLRRPKPGYLCLTVDGMNASLLSLFVETGWGKTMVTLMWVLFAGAMAQEAEIRERWGAAVDRMFPMEAKA